MAPATILFEALVTFLRVAVTGLDRCAVTVTGDAVTGTTTLLGSTATSDRTMCPFRPGRPSILWVVILSSTAWATLSVGNSGIRTWNEGTGNFATDSCRVLAGTLGTAVHSPFIFVVVHNAIMEANSSTDFNLSHEFIAVFSHFTQIIR